MTPSLSLKFIGKSISEGALFASATFQAFEFIVASTSIANFQMIVDLFLIPNREGARAVPITHYSASEGDQSLSSASDKSIMFLLTTIHVQWLIVEFIKADINVQGSRAPSTTFPMMHNRKSKFIVASHDSKTFLHFSKSIAIFCERDQENVNNGNDMEDNDVVVWQKSNLPSLLSLTSAISTQAALDASAPSDTLAATASFGQISLINLSASSNHWPIGLIGLISLGLISLGLISLVSLSGFGHVGLSGISGLVGQISLLGVSFINGFVGLSASSALPGSLTALASLASAGITSASVASASSASVASKVLLVTIASSASLASASLASWTSALPGLLTTSASLAPAATMALSASWALASLA
jgi:hypothetical protein